MSISSRNRRAIVYPYAATDDHGYMTSAYGPARGTYFVRVSPVPGVESTVGAQAEHTERMIFEFGDAVTIAKDDLIVENAVQWKVESVTLRRGSRAVVVRAFRVDDEPNAPTS
jgi:hypothetical protein